MNPLQESAIRDQVIAIKREASEKYDLINHCLSEGEYEGAADLLERANRLMALAARLEARQGVHLTAKDEALLTTIAAEHATIMHNVESCK